MTAQLIRMCQLSCAVHTLFQPKNGTLFASGDMNINEVPNRFSCPIVVDRVVCCVLQFLSQLVTFISDDKLLTMVADGRLPISSFSVNARETRLNGDETFFCDTPLFIRWWLASRTLVEYLFPSFVVEITSHSNSSWAVQESFSKLWTSSVY